MSPMPLKFRRFELKPMSFRERLNAQREVRIVKASQEWKRKNYHKPIRLMSFLRDYEITQGR